MQVLQALYTLSYDKQLDMVKLSLLCSKMKVGLVGLLILARPATNTFRAILPLIAKIWRQQMQSNWFQEKNCSRFL